MRIKIILYTHETFYLPEEDEDVDEDYYTSCTYFQPF
jgi:hypothetical protein